MVEYKSIVDREKDINMKKALLDKEILELESAKRQKLIDDRADVKTSKFLNDVMRMVYVADSDEISTLRENVFRIYKDESGDKALIESELNDAIDKQISRWEVDLEDLKTKITNLNNFRIKRWK
jgi:hypothetical protein